MYAPRNTSSRRRISRTAARGLGWLSIGLGVAQLVMPRAIAGATGMRGGERAVRACGLREIATGIGLLAARRPGPWLWARVAGDALDLAGIGSGRRRARSTAKGLMAALAGVTAFDAACAAAVERIERRGRAPSRTYGDRRGLPLPPLAMRGVARRDFEMPSDMATPALLAPWPPTALRP